MYSLILIPFPWNHSETSDSEIWIWSCITPSPEAKFILAKLDGIHWSVTRNKFIHVYVVLYNEPVYQKVFSLFSMHITGYWLLSHWPSAFQALEKHRWEVHTEVYVLFCTEALYGMRLNQLAGE